MIRVLVADDQFLIRQGIASLLAATPDLKLVAEASDGGAAVSAHQTHGPDVAIINTRLPHVDGLAAIARIRAADAAVGIIALSAHEGDEEIHRALQAGANTYVFKRSAGCDLVEMVRAVADGQRPLPSEVANRLQYRATRPPLTRREHDVLNLVAAGKANKEIAAALDLSVNTVNTHVANLLQKLGVEDRTQAVTMAARRGLVRLDQPLIPPANDRISTLTP